jgi:hypothetical protein
MQKENMEREKVKTIEEIENRADRHLLRFFLFKHLEKSIIGNYLNLSSVFAPF